MTSIINWIPLLMLPLEAIAIPQLLKLISDLIAFDRLVYWDIQMVALTLMTSSKACTWAENDHLRLLLKW